jgi:protein-L-isoaspartate(D-aspartate) O-methyltransferase
MSTLVDSYKHQGLRRQLIDTLKHKGISRKEVLDAMMRVPRHYFLDSAFLDFAYSDKAFPIGAGQTISQPYTVAFQTSLLEVGAGQKVLEIGTGSGYQTAVLTTMGVKVYTVERQKNLFKSAQQLLAKLNSTAKLFFGDGYKGLPSFAPFDRVLVTCGAPFIPKELIEQLKPGGILVVPLGEGDVQEMTKLVKNLDGTVEISNHGAFRFVPMLQDKEAS